MSHAGRIYLHTVWLGKHCKLSCICQWDEGCGHRSGWGPSALPLILVAVLCNPQRLRRYSIVTSILAFHYYCLDIFPKLISLSLPVSLSTIRNDNSTAIKPNALWANSAFLQCVTDRGILVIHLSANERVAAIILSFCFLLFYSRHFSFFYFFPVEFNMYCFCEFWVWSSLQQMSGTNQFPFSSCDAGYANISRFFFVAANLSFNRFYCNGIHVRHECGCDLQFSEHLRSRRARIMGRLIITSTIFQQFWMTPNSQTKWSFRRRRRCEFLIWQHLWRILGYVIRLQKRVRKTRS